MCSTRHFPPQNLNAPYFCPIFPPENAKINMLRPLLFILALLFSLIAVAQTLDPALAPFYHGVASGDPLSDRVILWTRVTIPSPPPSIEVRWQVATDTAFQNVVRYGTTSADAIKDYTVKVDADGLMSYTCYYYRFWANGKYSIRGRTKTAPSTMVSQLKFAIMSCANYSGGYFLGYNRVTYHDNVDAILFLGDYVYEYESSSFLGGTRPHQPDYECLTLSDYRTRHAQYKADPELRRTHQQFPFIMVWDDHETANDAWFGGAQNHDPATEGDWFVRKAAGIQAYFEWQPIRLPDPVNNPTRTWRKISYGNLLDIFMLDTRLYGRQEQDGTSNNDPNRTLLGADQYNWIAQELLNSTAVWKIIGQQVMIAPMRVFGAEVNGDQWDGYPAEKQRLLNHIINNNIQNVVVATGDIHSSWGNDVPYTTYNANTGAGSAAVEFVTPSVTTSNFPFNISQSIIQLFNSHVKYVDLDSHGYIVLDVNANRVQGDWYHTPEPTSPSYTDQFVRAHYVNAGERHLRQASQAAPPLTPCLKAPLNPTPEGVEYRIRALLEGCYLLSRGEMETELRADGLLPLSQPFATAPWSYNGTESVGNISQIPNDVTDWVLVELRDANNPAQIVARAAGWIWKDGTITDIDARPDGIRLTTGLPNEPYYIVVRGRNHVAVMSRQPVLPFGSNAPYDFTTALTQADNEQQMSQLPFTNTFALRVGDYNHDGIVNVFDYHVWAGNDGQINVYQNADGTLDGEINYNDFAKYLPNDRHIGVQWIRY